ncbi:MAG: guanylate kinase [Bdellovibrionales bacterium]|nr:guanylate kinase [Bdellovibrionales bacterium]
MVDTQHTFHPPLLIVISAPSGAGKTTLCARLLDEFNELRLSISTTTRPPRGQERHGREYFFTSRDEFESQIGQGHFAEWANVHGNYYGTSKKVIEDSLLSGQSVLLDIDVQGAESLKKTFSNRCVSIFIAPPSMQELENRLRSRGTDPESSIQKRLHNARQEMAQASRFDFQLVNDNLEVTYKRLSEIVGKALGRKH